MKGYFNSLLTIALSTILAIHVFLAHLLKTRGRQRRQRQQNGKHDGYFNSLLTIALYTILAIHVFLAHLLKTRGRIDSGADKCVFPASTAVKLLPRTTSLVAANGSNIHTFGKRFLRVYFAPGHQAEHSFWIATVNRPILGADFFTSQIFVEDDWFQTQVHPFLLQ